MTRLISPLQAGYFNLRSYGESSPRSSSTKGYIKQQI